MNQEHLERYAALLLKQGVNIQTGQTLLIGAEILHRDLMRTLVEQAYGLGAAEVRVTYSDPVISAERVRHAEEHYLRMSHRSRLAELDRLVAEEGALISIRGPEFPDLAAELEREFPGRAKLNTAAATESAEIARRYGINKGMVSWLVAAAVGPGWAKQVFPELKQAEAEERLWEEIFRITQADQPNCLELAQQRDEALQTRSKALNDLEIKTLRLKGGGSDFEISLSEKARWMGGSKATRSGQRFQANIPSLENFTTPDWRTARGRVQTTRPFLANGVLIRDLWMEFEEGRVVDFDCSEGKESFGSWIDTDAGARQIGEFALVGLDSPIAQSRLTFYNTLYDENALCHIALGTGYTLPIEGGQTMSDEELASLGRNISKIHTDMMISSEEVSIYAELRDGRADVPIIVDGNWDKTLAE